MELLGLLFAIPVSLAASCAYSTLLWAFFRYLPGISRVIAPASYVVVASILVEVALISAMGAKGSYVHLGYKFTALHLFDVLLGPPAIANLVYFFAARCNLNLWLRFSSAALCCWIACFVGVLGHITIDEAIVGSEAGKPFFLIPRNELVASIQQLNRCRSSEHFIAQRHQSTINLVAFRAS